VPTGDGWVHEVKFDGYRVQAHKLGSRVVIYSRNECLRAFRRVIEPDGFRVLCQGARPNVCPSMMARQMDGAWKSYVHTLGQPGSMNDLVGTFDPVEDIASVGTVQEQDEFMRRHREEFKKRARSLGG
jgi:hypothetical protein